MYSPIVETMSKCSAVRIEMTCLHVRFVLVSRVWHFTWVNASPKFYFKYDSAFFLSSKRKISLRTFAWLLVWNCLSIVLRWCEVCLICLDGVVHGKHIECWYVREKMDRVSKPVKYSKTSSLRPCVATPHFDVAPPNSFLVFALCYSLMKNTRK